MTDQKQSGFSNFVNSKILPPIMKFVNTKAIVALQNGMIYTLPFIIVGSIFLILSNIPIPAVANAINASGWGAIFNQAYTTTFNVMALWGSIGIAYIYVKNEGYEPLAGGLTACASFLMLQTLAIDSPLKAALTSGINNGQMSGKVVAENIDKLPHALQTFLEAPVTGVININWLGGDGMIAAIIVGLIVGWAYSSMMKAGWTIKLPKQVPPAVSNQFTAMIPAGVILIVTMLIFGAFNNFAHTDFLQWVYKTIQSPLQGVSDSFGGAVVIAFLVPFFWFFGVHGPNVLAPVLEGIWGQAQLINIDIFQKGYEGKTGTAAVLAAIDDGKAYMWVRGSFDAFAWFGGSGGTIVLIIAILLFSKRADYLTVGKLSLGPGIFNINEPIMFGLPVVLNPIMFIPFVIAPLVATTIGWVATYLGLVAPVSQQVAWVTPPLLLSFLATGADWRAPIVALVCMVVTFLIWTPFVIAANKMDPALSESEQ